MRSAQSKDISITWTCFLMKTVGLWLAADRAEQRRRNFALVYTISAISIATCIAIRDLYYSWGNFNDCVYIACNILYLMIVLFKIAVLYVHKMEFFDLIRYTQTNFWHSNYDRQEKLILDDCKRLCAIFIVVLSFCTQGTCAGYLVTPLLGELNYINTVAAKFYSCICQMQFPNVGKNESDRILPFNMWVDFPTGISPYFEVLFIIQILCVYHVGVCYICFDNFLCLANLHVSSQFRVLQYRLISLNDIVKKQIRARASNEILSSYENECSQKLKNCVHQHQSLTEYCRMLENIFAVIVLGQVLFLAMVMCLVGYQLFLADTPPSKSVSLILNMAAVICQLYMFTYSCDGLMQQSSNVGSATFSGPWAAFSMDKTGKLLRKNITIIIMRSNRSCCLTASGFFPVSLETYTGVLSTAMSYFTLLRQSTLDMEST